MARPAAFRGFDHGGVCPLAPVTLRWLVEAGSDARIAFLGALVLTTALNFLGGRAISKGRADAHD